MFVQLKHKFLQASGAPYVGFLAKAMVVGTNTPLKVYNSAGIAIGSDMLTSADGSVSGYFDDGKPVSFVLFDGAGNEVERTSGVSSGDNTTVDATKPTTAALLDTGTTALVGRRLLNTTAGTIASHTFQLPSAPEDGAEYFITTRGAITTVTVTAPGGQTIVAPALTTLAAGGSAGWVYTAADTRFSRIQ